MAYALFIGLVAAGCGDKGGNASTPAKTADPVTPASTSSNPTGSLTDLKIEDQKKGDGKAAVGDGDQVWVLYTGKLENGTVFDSTEKKNNTPFHFVVGTGSVIPGWDKGLQGMHVGGKRHLSIPWKLAYGENGHDPIPGKADLYFDIELKGLIKKGDEMTVETKDTKIGTGPEAKVGDKVTVDYKWSTIMGDVVDDQKNFSFKIGKNEIIDGMDYGVRGMKVGGTRHMILPPMVGYMQGTDKLPPNSILIVDATLKKIN